MNKNEVIAAMKAGRDTITEVLGAGRVTDDQRGTIEASFKAAEEYLDWKRQTDESAALMAKIGRLDPSDDYDGEVFSPFVKAVQDRRSYAVTVGRKAFGSGALTLPSAGEEVFASTGKPTAVALRDLFNTENVTTASVRYYKLDHLSGAATVAEGAAKPALTGSYTPVDAAVQKIAGTFSYTYELAEDAPFMVAQIQQNALQAILDAENSLILSSMGGASGIQTGTGTDLLDTIAGAIGSYQALTGVSPDGIVINPADLASIRKAKASTAGSYVLDPTQPGPPSLFGVAVAPMPLLTAGTVWLTKRNALTVYQRDGVRITTGLSGNDLVNNTTTVVVEERMVPAVVQPFLLSKLTITAD